MAENLTGDEPQKITRYRHRHISGADWTGESIGRGIWDEDSILLCTCGGEPFSKQPFGAVTAGQSEQLILKYNPEWTDCNEMRHPIAVPDIYHEFFTIENEDVFDVHVPFTRESWNGRMKACRGIGASLPEEDIGKFHEEHLAMLEETAPRRFDILHYAAMTTMRKK